jgi:cyclic-di-GMP-binding protein
MAKESSFDVVSQLDLQEVDNAVNQTAREVATRYDLKGSGSTISLDRQNGEIHLESAAEFHLKAVIDVLQSKLVHRKISLKAVSYGKVEPASGGTVRQTLSLVQGIDQDHARALAKSLKDSKLGVRTQIEGEKLRVFAKKRDTLQEAIALMKEEDVDIPLQFTNYRD